MVILNKNFGIPVMSAALSEIFRGATDQQVCDGVSNTGSLASGSTLVSSRRPLVYDSGDASKSYASTAQNIINQYKAYWSKCYNFQIVTEHFIRVLDKFYTKLYNETFTETGIFSPSNLSTLYSGFVNDLSSAGGILVFKKVIDRAISAGYMDEEDRLQYADQVFITDALRANLSTNIDTENRLVTIHSSVPIDVTPDINIETQTYLQGKKLFLAMTPHLSNESTDKGYGNITQEPFPCYSQSRYDRNIEYSRIDWVYTHDDDVKQPFAFFKPKTSSKFGRSVPLGTHLFFSMGTPEDKEAAITNGTPVPELIFDHLDRISHIDSFTIKINIDRIVIE